MGAKAVNMDAETKALLEQNPSTDVLEVNPGKHITKHKALSWLTVSKEAAARHKDRKSVV